MLQIMSVEDFRQILESIVKNESSNQKSLQQVFTACLHDVFASKSTERADMAWSYLGSTKYAAKFRTNLMLFAGGLEHSQDGSKFRKTGKSLLGFDKTSGFSLLLKGDNLAKAHKFYTSYLTQIAWDGLDIERAKVQPRTAKESRNAIRSLLERGFTSEVPKDAIAELRSALERVERCLA